MQRELDREIKRTGAQNAYFPLFIPLSYFEEEAEHVEGFAKEMAVVTHHRLEADPDAPGKLRPQGELAEPLIVRPTSETVIGKSFAKWIDSYRDLPLMINQWANVVRWELRPRVLLRTTEFLWQEGHTAHATEAEAREETEQMLEVYRELRRVLPGDPGPHRREAGRRAVSRAPSAALSIEAMMQDGKALQAGTSHYLGQGFAEAAEIRFLDRDGNRELVHTSSWGVSTRLLGALVMSHCRRRRAAPAAAGRSPAGHRRADPARRVRLRQFVAYAEGAGGRDRQLNATGAKRCGRSPTCVTARPRRSAGSGSARACR